MSPEGHRRQTPSSTKTEGTQLAKGGWVTISKKGIGSSPTLHQYMMPIMSCPDSSNDRVSLPTTKRAMVTGAERVQKD